jgi:hypothetical protein
MAPRKMCLTWPPVPPPMSVRNWLGVEGGLAGVLALPHPGVVVDDLQGRDALLVAGGVGGTWVPLCTQARRFSSSKT